MCPDSQLLSVYFDGELPSPWKEKIEVHITSCPECASLLEKFRICRDSFQETSPNAEAAKERVMQKLSPYLNSPIPTAPLLALPKVRHRYITLPLPAAVAAVAIFIFAFIFALVRPFAPDSTPVISSTDSTINLDVQNIVPAADMSGVLQYLGQQDSSDFLIIRLPESRNFTISGDPMIIKASDYPDRRVGSQ
jgi:anti-sigma factor RsiW